jgi:phosphatidylglycerol:prolipoprotein diacylglycerol transferase
MHPVLFELPWGTANAYGTLILLGGCSTLPGVIWDARRRGIGGGKVASFVIDFYLVLILGAAVGGRVLHILTVPGDYLEDPSRLVSMSDSGFVFFGSLLFIFGGWVWLARRYGTKLSTIADLGATWMALGHGFGRLGCLMAGCCWGAPTPSAWGVEFPAESVVYLSDPALRTGEHTVALHPVAAYEAAGLFVLLLVLVAIRIRRGIEAPWRQASRYAAGYGGLRAITEIFRADGSRGFVFEATAPWLSSLLGLPADHPVALSISQLTALLLVAVGVYGLRRSRTANS